MKKNNSSAAHQAASASKFPHAVATPPQAPRKSALARKQNGNLLVNGGDGPHVLQKRAEKPAAKRPSDFESRELLRALLALKKGDFSVRMAIDWTGTAGKIADTFNEVAESMEQSTEDLSRIS